MSRHSHQLTLQGRRNRNRKARFLAASRRAARPVLDTLEPRQLLSETIYWNFDVNGQNPI